MDKKEASKKMCPLTNGTFRDNCVPDHCMWWIPSHVGASTGECSISTIAMSLYSIHNSLRPKCTTLRSLGAR